MKKKFLSLMMAAAVVATTSVSAFAKDYKWTEGTDQNADVTITGNVANDQGHFVPGTLSVSIPTATTFTVDQSGNLKAPQITVENKGTETVDVYAYKFVDQTSTVGDRITVIPEGELESADSTAKVTLKLDGNRGSAHLKTVDGATGTGVYAKAECETDAGETGAKLVSVEGNTSESITVSGKTKKNATVPSKPIEDKFVLTLKIKKAQAQSQS